MSSFTCSAIRVQQPSVTFYVGAVNATDLETICLPLRRAAGTGLFSRDIAEPESLSESQLNSLVRSLESPKFRTRSTELLTEERAQPYQRFLDEKRAVEIARYLQQPTACLPNSIILAVNVDLDEADVIVTARKESDMVEIILPRDGSSAVILDGQHRVAALRYLDAAVRNNFQVVVTFLVGVPFYQQAEIFAIINGKQKPVNKSIIYDLFGYAPIDASKEERLYEGLMAVSRFCSHVARILNSIKESPWMGKIKMRGPGDEGVISQAAVVEYLSALVEPKTFSTRLKVLPLLYSYFKNESAAGCASLLILYLRAVQLSRPEFWQNSKSLYWKTNGVAVMLRILHDEIMLAGGPEAVMDKYHAIVERWRRAPANDIKEPPKSGGGGIQTQLYERFFAVMFSLGEKQRIAEMREVLKEKLGEIGGLIR
ncbi:MAG: DGQHR domain-containing protein [Limisphaerales bacterium]